MNERFDDDGENEAATSNAGVILTSTLWSQSGTVYVSVDGVQTKLTGYTYNKFCPNYAEGSRAITGCTNTADAQILYYWIEQGYDLALSVTTENYFKIKNDSTTYYVSDTANAGEGTLTEINKILSSSDRIGNGDFIAALNFFCGVNNHSSYGSTTSTSWSYSVSATGKNTAAFAAAGFDSHYFIARKASGSVPGLFFTGDDGLSEVGLSILRENLDYGEPIRVGIPNHAIYMDGYRVNSETGEYEYHLNYGYGPRSSSTKWYTVSDLEGLTIGYLAIDISPEVKVRVSNAREDYYGGSFLRGLERINHIVNDRSTTFTFDPGLAGETITLDGNAKITSAVDVAFQNIAVSLATTAAELFASARGMSFDISGGSLIVNSAGAAYAIRETGDSAVNVTVTDGFIYTGNMAGGISAVRELLTADGGYRFGDFDADFYASVAGCAVRSGGAADTVTLVRDAALFGKLDLGAGDNILDLGAGSLFYGAFAGAANTLTVNLTVDNAAGTGATVALADEDSGQAFHAATRGILNLHFSSPGMEEHSYELLRGGGDGLARMFSVILTVEDETVVLDAEENEYGCFTLAADDGKLVLNYAPTPPAVLSVVPDITEPTNGDVTLTATFSGDASAADYSTDGIDWRSYTALGVVMKDNGTVYFRANNSFGMYSEVTSFTVSNIDRTAPAITLSGDNLTPAHQATLSAATDDGSGLYYRIGGAGEWLEYTSPITVDVNADYEFRSTDAAGNTGSASIGFANILPWAPQNPVSSPERQTWDTTGAARYIVEYSTDGFVHALTVAATDTELDSPGLPAGTYSWRVKADDHDGWLPGEDIVAEAAAAPRVLSSDEDAAGDLFFAVAAGTWDCCHRAVHRGSVADWNGTGEAVAIGGKGRFGDFFFGSGDPNLLLLTDSSGGDALFIDDIFTELPETVAENRSRLAGIREIRAGDGDDVVDMTSRRFEYTGSGLTIRGGDGDDTIWANKGDNKLFGDAGNDRIVGASGNDVIVGGIGNDRMHGGGNNDIFTFCDNWGTDEVEQLPGGSVTLWFVSGSEENWNAETLTYTNGENSVKVSGVSAEQITLKFGDDGSAQFAALNSAGAFFDATTERIFEENGKGMLASL